MTAQSMSTVAEIVVDPADLCHTACCEDQDLGLCGIDVTGHEWDDDGSDPECAACERLVGVDCSELCLVQALRNLKAGR